MREIEFSKYNGQGNDFVIINATGKPVNLSEDQVRSVCDRHFGIGSDGLIIVKKSDKADFYMDYYNMDGSKAEMCGNGIRCMAGFIFEKGLSSKSSLKIDTLSGIRDIEMTIDGGLLGAVTVDMNRPIFEPGQIPVNLEGAEVFGHKLSVGNRVFSINCISMGNPHCIIYLDKNEELADIPMDIWGPAIERHELFPNRTNVEFVQLAGVGRVKMRVWERGVGETLACGTGACAAGVCTIKLGKITGSSVNVAVSGGNLNVLWENPSGNVFLEGKVQHVFDGIYYM